MMGRSRLSKRILPVAAGLAALLVGAVVVHATKDSKTSDSLTYAGTLTGVGAGMQTFSFVLHNGANNCAVTKATNVSATGAFAVTFSAADSSCLTDFFDGGDVTVDISVAGASITGQPVTPVPYAKYADTAVNYAPKSPIANIVPVGTVIAYAGTTAPPGWLLCNGASLLRADYPELFGVIQTNSGAADGTHFNLPDYRGVFLRGAAQTSPNDPDRASRVAAAPGGAIGDNVGSFQPDAIKRHTHTLGSTTLCAGSTCTATMLTSPTQGSTESGDTNLAGAAETRPKNVAVNYLIKY